MVLKILDSPKATLTNVTTGDDLTEWLASFKVTLRENAVSIATLGLDNDENILAEVATTDSLNLTVGETSSTASPIFYGYMQYPTATFNKNLNRTNFSCIHKGYGLCDMLVSNAYGSQSALSSLDTIKEILTDTTDGILPKYVDKILNSATSSNWSLSAPSYIADHIATITDVIRYQEFPYIPADKAIDNLIDIVTALRSPSAGPHWIVDNNGFFRLKLLGTSQTASAGSGAPDWTLWHGGTDNTLGQATIVLGDDADLVDYQQMQPEGNYILNYGLYRHPTNRALWCKTHTDWGSSDSVTLSTDSGSHIFSDTSVRGERTSLATPITCCYPSSQDLALDITSICNTPYQIPFVKFFFRSENITSAKIKLLTNSTTGNQMTLFDSIAGPDFLDGTAFIELTIPIGSYYRGSPTRQKGMNWGTTWNANVVNYIEFEFTGAVGCNWNIDGLCFGDVPIIRAAFNSDLPSGAAKMRLITDMIPCDDSLIATDDSGTMAQLVKAEYLRQSTAAYAQTVKVPIIPDALPGQQFSLNSVTYRATEIIHEYDGEDMTTTLSLNSDLINGRARKRHDDLKKTYENFLPNSQNRQSTSIKAGAVDYRIPRLAKDYA